MATDRSKQYPKIVKDGKVVSVGTQGNREVTASGLSKGTDYAKGAFQLYWDENSNTSISNNAKDAHIDSPAFTTKLSAPDAPTLKITPATTSLKVDITHGSSDGAPDNNKQDITKYALQYHKDGDDFGNPENITPDEDGNGTFTISDLTQNTKYTVRVKAINKDGESDYSKATQDATTLIQHPTGVTLDKATASLHPGDTVQLTATVAPENANSKAVTWSSSDETLATVDSTGKVTAKANGSATITVTTTDGSKTATAKITVTTLVTGVTLDKTTLGVNTGATGQLTATVAPASASNKSVTWTSDNTAVATVDSTGKVTGVKAGTANVTVKTTDGAKSASAKVTVTDPVVHPTGVSLDKTTADATVGDTVQLTATVAPSNSTDKKVNWSSSDETLATVDNTGKVTTIKAGEATITASTNDGAKTATCKITITDKPAEG